MLEKQKPKILSENNNAIAKDNLMLIIIIGVWLIIVLYFDPKILEYLYKQSLFAKFALISFLICVNIFWFYGIYHLVIAFFSAFIVKPVLAPLTTTNSPQVALFYLTMNDFQENAVLSCLKQDYKNFELFILDDSTDRNYQHKIDCFIQHHPNVKLIRRLNRKNYKAGNLNNALNTLYKDYAYFAISDADGILPENFLKKLMPYFNISPKIAFVQANQRWNNTQKTEFAQNLGLNTDIHWKYYVPAKFKYGFLMFYGHGAIIKSSVWKQIHGFPDTVTEDIAFSSLLCEKGYKGTFVPDVVCLEDFPADYKAFRKRNQRWIKGTIEYLLKWYPKLLFSRNASYIEKIDMLISCGILLQSVIFVIFLIIVSIILPLSAKLFYLHIPLIVTFAPLKELTAAYSSGVYLYCSWSMEFFLIMLITSFAQFAPLGLRFFYQPVNVICYYANFTFICLSSCVAGFIHLVSFLFTRNSYFLATGQTNKKITVEEKIIFALEIIFAFLLIYSMIKTANVWLLTAAAALLLSPFIYKKKSGYLCLNILIYLPFILIIGIIFFIVISLI
ncbi:MAG: hypothetical protein DRP78_05205 [Candidatus Omnitrophota bacterium]|nr:MAG: hypothetical protein DRP78_05205 [Candidatus Omnitrophota bacterium]